MAELYEQENVELQKLTAQYARELTRIWSRIFDENSCLDNLVKLKTHAQNFYDDLIEESSQKQALIENEISKLYKEAETLSRLLNTEVQLPCVDDGNTPLLIVQAEIDKSLTELREQLKQRRDEIYELLLEQEELCEELGEASRPLTVDPLPTIEHIQHFRNYLEELKNERMERMNKLSHLRREIKSYLQILEVNVDTETEDRLLNHRQIKLHNETFAGLQHMQNKYGARVQEMRDRIDSMRLKLETLWERLNTSPATRNKFKRHNDCSKETYASLYSELTRCETLKSQNIKDYVQQIRREIVEWWDKTLKSETQRSRFIHFTNKSYTDDLLGLHEMELEDLKCYYDCNRQIFELYESRKLLWDRMTALEAKASDPGRYNNRGGQLLKEEKERKVITTKLPKIEQQITDLVRAYEEREREPFLVHGENILSLMAGDWEKKRQEKEKMSSARKNAQTPLSKSQLGIVRTPMSLRNVSTVSMRKAPSNSNLSTISSAKASSTKKRKLHPNDKPVPLAKRSLIYTLNSPSVFLKPTTTSTASSNSAGRSMINKLPTKSAFKSPMKKTRVIATTIRRKSNRFSGSSSSKKRNSQGKSVKKRQVAAPKIVINENSDQYTDEGTDGDYECFQNCIEPASRSSMIQGTASSNISVSTRSKRLQQLLHDESTRRLHLPNPRQGFHPSTPSKLSPASGSRKLTTKNLPIII